MLEWLIGSRFGEARFAQLMNVHGQRWYRACLRLTQNAADAEDAVQEALLRAWKARTQFRGDAELATWVQRIAINCAIDGLRRRAPEWVDAAVAETAIPEPALDCALSTSQGIRDLDHALQQLSDLERVCCVLKHAQGLSLKEISQHCQISEGSVKQALFRALAKLRLWMHDRYE